MMPLKPDLSLAAELFNDLGRATRQGRGIVRDSYGAGEHAAHDIIRRAASSIGLETTIDAIGNLTATLPGRHRALPHVIVGSHLDSVPQGGNYDGAAGVVAGITALATLQRAGIAPDCDISVMAIRGEESAWFDVPYIGSAGALGLLDPECLGVRRADTGETLESAMVQSGFDPDAIKSRRRLLDPAQVSAYLELHIEQGPTLVGKGLPAAVVTGIRGCKRFRNARCIGTYAHSGAVPRGYRRDAVAATVSFLHDLEAVWEREEKAGADLVVTTGELFTDPAMHGPSKIAGQTSFVIDIRSLSDATMNAVAGAARDAARQIGEKYRVRFELGATSDSPPALMNARLRARLVALLEQPFEMASGAGHDAAVFAKAGIPTGMIFVRNDNGSHNPEEAMDLDDFAVGTAALIGLILDLPR
jgi:beta-ureidopropionase / N-carbamoyl-L-amino-acid hydrolase